MEFLEKKKVEFFGIKQCLCQNIIVLDVKMPQILEKKKTLKNQMFLNTKKAPRIRKNFALF